MGDFTCVHRRIHTPAVGAANGSCRVRSGPFEAEGRFD